MRAVLLEVGTEVNIFIVNFVPDNLKDGQSWKSINNFIKVYW
jgi:hypothetical protein